MQTRYEDVFKCSCGHTYIINVPVEWAYNNMDQFESILRSQEKAQQDHFLCAWVHEVKQFLKQPVIVRVI